MCFILKFIDSTLNDWMIPAELLNDGDVSVQVKHPSKLRQVGVFLDVDEGQVSFYNVKSGSEIYSFTGSSEFTERMFPLLGTGDKETPLVLMTSPHHLAWGGGAWERRGGAEDRGRGLLARGRGQTGTHSDVNDDHMRGNIRERLLHRK